MNFEEACKRGTGVTRSGRVCRRPVPAAPVEEIDSDGLSGDTCGTETDSRDLSDSSEGSLADFIATSEESDSDATSSDAEDSQDSPESQEEDMDLTDLNDP